MPKTIAIILCLLMVSGNTMAQSFTPDSQTVNNKRLWIAVGANAVFWTGTYIALDKAWYSDYPKTSFHFFDDLAEWNQMDKAGHIWTTYQVSRASAELWKWAGLSKKTSAILGGTSGMVYQSIIEIQDGFSAEWGFSWSDMAANVIGAGLFTFQEIAWKEQRLQVKMSYWPAEYPNDELKARRNELFGNSSLERILKDYNSQTYWLSANVSSFLGKENKFPKWLNIAFGYGANGLLGGRTNIWENSEGITVDYTSIPRKREFYLSPDLDLTKIKTNSKALRTIFFILSAVKIPAPALEISGGKFSVKAIKF